MVEVKAGRIVLASEPMGAWELQSVQSDAIERVMPLTQSDLPEPLQGLFWMDQWGMSSPSGFGTRELLLSVGPDFLTQRKAIAQPDLVLSFVGLPVETVGNQHVIVVAVNPTDIGTWTWFGILRDQFLKDFKAGHGISAMYKFIFNQDWTECYIIPSLPLAVPPTMRFAMSYEGENRWIRKTYTDPEMQGPSLDYTVHRIVDGAGNRLSAYSDYLATANLPEVSGTVNPGSVLLTRRPGATDNSQRAAMLPETGAWPDWADELTWD